MKNIAFLALFLISITGYGQLTNEYGNEILSKFGLYRSDIDNRSTVNVCTKIIETPYGVFMNYREWVVEDKSFRSLVYLYLNDTLKKVEELNDYAIIDYSKKLDLFLIAKRRDAQLLGNGNMNLSFHTYDFKTNKRNDQKTKVEISNARFIDENHIEYSEYYTTKTFTLLISK